MPGTEASGRERPSAGKPPPLLCARQKWRGVQSRSDKVGMQLQFDLDRMFEFGVLNLYGRCAFLVRPSAIERLSEIYLVCARRPECAYVARWSLQPPLDCLVPIASLGVRRASTRSREPRRPALALGRVERPVARDGRSRHRGHPSTHPILDMLQHNRTVHGTEAEGDAGVRTTLQPGYQHKTRPRPGLLRAAGTWRSLAWARTLASSASASHHLPAAGAACPLPYGRDAASASGNGTADRRAVSRAASASFWSAGRCPVRGRGRQAHQRQIPC